MLRLSLTLSPSTEPLPFDHHSNLIGAFQKWAGDDNEIHDQVSLYSLGWLRGGRATPEGLAFPHGSQWQLSVYQSDLAMAILEGIRADPYVYQGMSVRTVQLVEPPDLENAGEPTFFVDSPVVIRDYDAQGRRRCLKPGETNADSRLTEVLARKLNAAGRGDLMEQASIRFLPEDPKQRTTVVRLKGTVYPATFCRVIVTGGSEVAQFVWCVGVGEKTGCGFGAVR